MRINYPLAIYKAERFEDLAERLSRMSLDMKYIFDYGRDGWRGEASNAYFESCLTFDNKLKKAADNINNFSLTLRKTAEAIKNADEQMLIP